jgi:hypothetical protein
LRKLDSARHPRIGVASQHGHDRRSIAANDQRQASIRQGPEPSGAAAI